MDTDQQQQQQASDNSESKPDALDGEKGDGVVDEVIDDLELIE